MRTLLLTLTAALVLAVGAGTAQGFDRSPVTVYGLHPDSWGQSTTTAQAQLRDRYPGIRVVYCVGAIMAQDPADSYFTHGNTRYWDKLVCAGYTYSSNTVFALIFDSKGRHSFTIYRLKGVTVAALRR